MPEKLALQFIGMAKRDRFFVQLGIESHYPAIGFLQLGVDAAHLGLPFFKFTLSHAKRFQRFEQIASLNLNFARSADALQGKSRGDVAGVERRRLGR
jgi:hypothetical protein